MALVTTEENPVDAGDDIGAQDLSVAQLTNPSQERQESAQGNGMTRDRVHFLVFIRAGDTPRAMVVKFMPGGGTFVVRFTSRPAPRSGSGR
ncbi:MAG: hypothetical protein Q8O70_07175 [Burkholderiales bacterium]|nr:hypothetical protein [Burkholderiales bacterium]